LEEKGRLRKKRAWIKIIVLVELPGPLLPYSFCKNQEAPLELMEIGLQYLLVNYFRNPFLQDDQWVVPLRVTALAKYILKYNGLVQI
jgi:hypothetical protein